MSWWRVIDTTGWIETDLESRGLRDKRWLVEPAGLDDVPWLRKAPRGARYTEPAVEAFTLALAERCGFEVATGHAAVWRIDGAELRGFISRRFHEPVDEQQFDGAELIGIASDSAASRIRATLDVIYGELRSREDRYGVDLCGPFLRTVAFDAWIGNGDRHTGNWALLVGRSAPTCRFAPMFDTAGCLGTELLDNHRCFRAGADDDPLQSYAARCRSGYGDGAAVPGISQRDVLAKVSRWPEWAAAYATVTAACKKVLATSMDEMLSEVPDAWWPTARREFARRLLALRVKILEQAAP